MQTMREKAAHYQENFDFCDSWEEKYQYLIDLGKSLAPMSPEYMVDENLVEGCLSQVWLVVECVELRLHITAQSDAAIVRGVIALISDLCQSQRAEDIIKFDFTQFFADIGLADQLSPNRRNGLVAFYQRVQAQAQHYCH